MGFEFELSTGWVFIFWKNIFWAPFILAEMLKRYLKFTQASGYCGSPELTWLPQMVFGVNHNYFIHFILFPCVILLSASLRQTQVWLGKPSFGMSCLQFGLEPELKETVLHQNVPCVLWHSKQPLHLGVSSLLIPSSIELQGTIAFFVVMSSTPHPPCHSFSLLQVMYIVSVLSP